MLQSEASRRDLLSAVLKPSRNGSATASIADASGNRRIRPGSRWGACAVQWMPTPVFEISGMSTAATEVVRQKLSRKQFLALCGCRP